MSESGPTFRQLDRGELDVVLQWAAAEGWNPGLADADAFWAADPEGFIGEDVDGEWVGSASLVAYDREHAFAGLFILRPEFRGHGDGDALARHLMAEVGRRLAPDATVAIDGVFAMQAYYATLGFEFSHRNLRMGGVAQVSPAEPPLPAGTRIASLADLPFEDVVAYDARHFGVRRPEFLRRWIAPSGGLGIGVLDAGGSLVGMGVVRPAQVGFKVGPLFAESPQIAETAYSALAGHAAGTEIFLDVPECNDDAVALAERHGLVETFGCARMFRGKAPTVPWQHVYGGTTFELG